MSDKCSICGTNAKSLQIYKIYYGKKGDSATANFVLEGQTTTKYSINPESLTVLLCNSCINKERSSKRFFGMILISLGLFLSWFFYSANLGSPSIIMMLCAILFFGGVGYFKLLIANEDDKAQIARNVAKKQLTQLGFNAFFTEAKYKSLKKLPEFPQHTGNKGIDELFNLLRIIEVYGSNEAYYMDGSSDKALIAMHRLANIDNNDPRVRVALSNILSKLQHQRSTFQHPTAQIGVDNLISIIFEMVTKTPINFSNNITKNIISDTSSSKNFNPSKKPMTLIQFILFMASFFGMFYVSLNISGWIIMVYITVVLFGPRWSVIQDEQVRFLIVTQTAITVIGLIIIYIR